MLILIQPGEGNSHLTGGGRRTLPVRVLILKPQNKPSQKTTPDERE